MSDVPSTTSVRILGAATAVPGPGQDTSCVLINGHVLVDAGWNAAVNMQAWGTDPTALDALFITHCHHDHYLGLPHVLFFRAMRKCTTPLRIVGPIPDIADTVRRALAFLQSDRYPAVPGVDPEVTPVQGGHECEAGELHVRIAQLLHPTVSLCYRFEDRRTGATAAVAGDTAYLPSVARFVQGVDLLIHEASCGPGSRDPLLVTGHSGAEDAARIARDANVGLLCITHYPRRKAAEVLESARAVFPRTVLAEEGMELRIPDSIPKDG